MLKNASSYYDARWASEEKANAWAMNRASVILFELSSIGIQDPRILDLGCGSGWMTAILSQFGHAEGVDLAPKPARQFHPNLLFHDAQQPPNDSFDVVISQEVIEHVEHQSSYIENAYTVLRPGGYLIITTPNAPVSLRHPELLNQPVENHLSRQQLRQLLSTRFEVLKLYSFFFGYARWRPYRIQIKFGKLLNAGLHLIAVCKRSS